MSISRDGLMEIQLNAKENLGNLTNMINAKTFQLNLMNEKQQIVMYKVQSMDNQTGIVFLQLNFTGIEKVSAGRVSPLFINLFYKGTRHFAT